MKYDELLQHRDELLQAARLANLAYAYQWIGNFATRIARSELKGEVVLRGPNPEADRPQPVLAAQDFSQAVLDEHFLPEEINELHSVLAFVHDASLVLELRIRLEEIGSIYLPALRRALEVAEILPRTQPSASTVEDSHFDAA